MSMSPNQRRILSLSLAVLCILALASILIQTARHQFHTRGAPRELPGPCIGCAAAHGASSPGTASPFGINIEMLGWDDLECDTALARIAAAGFRWIKQPIPWNNDGALSIVRPGQGNGVWDDLDHLLESAIEAGLNVVPLLDGNPASQYAPPADPQMFANWAGQFAARFGDRVDFYQIWDEPNLGSHWGWEPVNPAEYAALLAAAHDAITAADPGAVIVAAALAPTMERGPANLSDIDYLDALYELGADAYFDVAAGKPYGFDSGPDDRQVSRDVLNFSRFVLLREVMEAHGDGDSALWAGNFGWNALPDGWTGRPSIWGHVDETTQAANTRAAYQRAADEWPWAGILFLEAYAPAAAADDPRWGFALIAPDGSPRSSLLATRFPDPIPSFQSPAPGSTHQTYTGSWRLNPSFGADAGASGDRVQVTFQGTDFGLRVRRGDYRAHFYVSVDGEPANALPADDRGAYLCLTSPDRSTNDVVTIPVARHLSPGRHTAEITADRGWDQWALVGFSAANIPDERPLRRTIALLSAAAIGLAAAAYWTGRGAGWGTWGRALQDGCARLGDAGYLGLTAAVAALFAATGWLAWLQPLGGPLRRLGDGQQTLLIAAVAALYFVSPWLLLNIVTGLALLLLIVWRLDLGLALIAFCAPFYVYPKPLAGYRFSPVEMIMLITLAAWALRFLPSVKQISPRSLVSRIRKSRSAIDLPIAFFVLVAAASLLFTERLDVATNELRMVVLEPALFYLLLRASKLDDRGLWRVVDGFVLGGLLVAVLGLVWYADGSHVITAEGGLPRLQSIYGSPNNVGLYLGRTVPILLAVALAGARVRTELPKFLWRKRLYGLALLPTLAAAALSFSKGAILLGLPVGIGLVLARSGRKTMMLMSGLVVLVVVGLLLSSMIPALSDRLSLAGATSDFRVSLWKASVDMIGDHPWIGVGLDNFLYAYRGRYIRPEAWQEPDLSHPHNIVLDFWTRLGLLGLAAGIWIQVAYWRLAIRFTRRPKRISMPNGALMTGLIGSMGATLAHGLVDQSYFLIDLAYAFMLAAGLVALLESRSADGR